MKKYKEAYLIKYNIGLSKIKTAYVRIQAKVGEDIIKYLLRHAVLILMFAQIVLTVYYSCRQSQIIVNFCNLLEKNCRKSLILYT
jgi:hypothetical protein